MVTTLNLEACCVNEQSERRRSDVWLVLPDCSCKQRWTTIIQLHEKSRFKTIHSSAHGTSKYTLVWVVDFLLLSPKTCTNRW